MLITSAERRLVIGSLFYKSRTRIKARIRELSGRDDVPIYDVSIWPQLVENGQGQKFRVMRVAIFGGVDSRAIKPFLEAVQLIVLEQRTSPSFMVTVEYFQLGDPLNRDIVKAGG